MISSCLTNWEMHNSKNTCSKETALDTKKQMFIKGNFPNVMKLEYMWLELGVLAAVEEVYCVQSALS